jgi:hypothetical protein
VWLRYTDPGFGDTKRIEVTQKSETPDAPYALPALERTTLQNPSAAAAAAAVIASTPESRATAAARIVAAANRAADGGRPLEAMLGYLEHNLMLGDLPADFKTRQAALTQNADVKTLFGALHASSEQEAKRNVATLKQLESAAGEKAYVLGIFRADFEGNLGNGETAIALLAGALSQNPFITGVWKDLGDALDGYDAADAWRCYEMARRIEPRHSLLAAVNSREETMLKEHPEFFGTP